jgi:hypothetical protein
MSEFRKPSLATLHAQADAQARGVADAHHGVVKLGR